jgi:hypothetical protein
MGDQIGGKEKKRKEPSVSRFMRGRGNCVDAGATVGRVVSVLHFERGMGTRVVAGVIVSHAIYLSSKETGQRKIYPSISRERK